MGRLHKLTEQLKEQGECVFSEHCRAIKIYEGAEYDFIYDIYNDYGKVLDGGVFNGTAKECIEYVLLEE